jgi:hypothetical protein
LGDGMSWLKEKIIIGILLSMHKMPNYYCLSIIFEPLRKQSKVLYEFSYVLYLDPVKLERTVATHGHSTSISIKTSALGVGFSYA